MPGMEIQVIGSGSWGLALARRLALNGHHVLLWCREEDNPSELRATRQSKVFLPGVFLPLEVEVVGHIEPTVELAVFAVPSHVMRSMAERAELGSGCVRVSVAKGIENGSWMRMSEVIANAAPGGGPIVSLSGPSHAEEVGRDLPASLVAAGLDPAACALVQQAFFSPTFRVYTSPDIVGVELGGSLKNVIAIAAGVCDGMELGDNAKAALITRGLAEMARLGTACGADPLTFAGLSGMGHLIVTCESRHSRNRSLGERIARGESLEAIQGASPMVAEGVRTTKSACALAEKHGVELPIAHAVRAVLFEGMRPEEALNQLLDRDAKPEKS
jgi:glycerol-3-phosphate dehydrogenase (NAD(P)+)